jgi:hypothetical protein
MKEHSSTQTLSEDKNLLLIKLIGRTGVCLNSLELDTVELLLLHIVHILKEREFIDVLLPWVSTITKHLSQ